MRAAQLSKKTSQRKDQGLQKTWTPIPSANHQDPTSAVQQTAIENRQVQQAGQTTTTRHSISPPVLQFSIICFKRNQ